MPATIFGHLVPFGDFCALSRLINPLFPPESRLYKLNPVSGKGEEGWSAVVAGHASSMRFEVLRMGARGGAAFRRLRPRLIMPKGIAIFFALAFKLPRQG